MLTETEIYDLRRIIPLLTKCGLTINWETDITVGIYDGDTLVATGSLCADMIQMVAVDPAYQGTGLSAKIVSLLLNHAYTMNAFPLYLFTKPQAAEQFCAMGFRLVTDASPYCVMLEYGTPGIREFCNTLKAYQKDGVNSALVMNCNPFTLGHRFLVEQAARNSEHVYLFVVQEDRSEIRFEDRLKMVELGTSQLSNVTVIPGGRYIISSLTFPNYFTKESLLSRAYAHVDACVFRDHIAPTLGITKRFVGTEPFSPTTDIYNQELQTVLPIAGVDVICVPRATARGTVISASVVRQLMSKMAYEEMKAFIPETTWDYLNAANYIKKPVDITHDNCSR